MGVGDGLGGGDGGGHCDCPTPQLYSWIALCHASINCKVFKHNLIIRNMAPTVAEIFRRLRHHLNAGLVKPAAKTFLIIEVTIRFRQICLHSNSIFLFRIPLGVHRVFVIFLMFEITQTGIELSIKNMADHEH